MSAPFQSRNLDSCPHCARVPQLLQSGHYTHCPQISPAPTAVGETGSSENVLSALDDSFLANCVYSLVNKLFHQVIQISGLLWSSRSRILFWKHRTKQVANASVHRVLRFATLFDRTLTPDPSPKYNLNFWHLFRDHFPLQYGSGLYLLSL